MDNLFLLAAIIGAVGFLVSGVTSIIQATASWPSVQQQHRKWLYIAIIAFFFVSVVSGGATYLTAHSSNFATTTTPTSTTIPTSPSPSSSANVITPISTTQLASGTIPFQHQQLTCGGCVNPTVITVDQATINPTKQNMTWSVKAFNRSGAPIFLYFSSFILQDSSGQSWPGGGDFLNAYSYGSGLVAGQTGSGIVTFPFIPNKSETYTLIAEMDFKSNNATVKFNTPFMF